MEKLPDRSKRVQITRDVFDGLEFIKQSGATNMLDRPVVLEMAREWGLADTADWIEQADTGTYGRLILLGPDVVDDDQTDRQAETDLHSQDIQPALSEAIDEHEVIDVTNHMDVTEMAMDHVRATMQELLSTLGKQAVLNIADTYETQRMGVMVNPSRNELISRERDALIRNLGEASRLWQQLDQAMTGVERGIGSLQYLIDPENN